MSADTIALVMVAIMAPFATLNVILYALYPWYRSLIGWRLMAGDLGLALLIDISLLYKAFGDSYALRDVVRLTVYALVLVGVLFTTCTLILAQRERRRVRRAVR